MTPRFPPSLPYLFTNIQLRPHLLLNWKCIFNLIVTIILIFSFLYSPGIFSSFNIRRFSRNRTWTSYHKARSKPVSFFSLKNLTLYIQNLLHNIQPRFHGCKKILLFFQLDGETERSRRYGKRLGNFFMQKIVFYESNPANCLGIFGLSVCPKCIITKDLRQF